MKVIIIDDEPLARMVIKEYLKSYPEATILQECSDGFEGVKAIQQHQPDLVFLDIQMPKINGFEMLELIENIPGIIFTTAFEEYAIKAFETHAVDYLLKPFSKERFDKAIQKFSKNKKPTPEQTQELIETVRQSVNNNRIVLKDGSKIKIIPTHQILYLEAADDYVKIYTNEGCFLKKKTMQFFEETLDSHQFLRIHRSYIVNIQLITRIDLYEKDGHIILLNTGIKLQVSKQGHIKLKEKLGI